MINILDKLPKRHQGQATHLLKKIASAETRKEAERLKQEFQAWCRKEGCPDAALIIDNDWDRLVSYYDYPKEHWKHLRTTNAIESPFSRVRLRTDASRRYKKVDNATTLIWKTLQIAEKRFQKLNSAELLKEVKQGVEYKDGVRVKVEQKEAAA